MGKNIPLNVPAFRPLALKYRPGVFAEVASQEAAARVLKSAAASGRIHSAYLFHGSRGSGKTSMARIFAKAINCGSKTGKNYSGEPCGECASCQDIAIGRSLDVLEIDAASHTGVDNVREAILDTINLSPARDPYRIFIIDEVHMLSGSAFNAMLKTLEEPPPNVVFILATTEFAKVPATVVSRTHSFLFRPLGGSVIEERLKEIAGKEKIKIEGAALTEIARAAGGSLRDALGLLQQMASLSYEGNSIRRDDVVRILGLVGEDVLDSLLDALAVHPDVARLKEAVEECLYKTGYAPGQLLGSLHARCARSLVDTVQDPSKGALAASFYALERHLASLLQDLRFTPDPVIACEAGLIGYLLQKNISEVSNPQPQQVLKPKAEAPQAVKAPPAPAPAPKADKPAPAPVKPAVKPIEDKKEPVPAPKNWDEAKAAFFASALQNSALKIYFETASLVKEEPPALEFSNLFNLKGAEQYKEAILSLWRKQFPGSTPVFRVRSGSEPPPRALEADGTPSDLPEDVKQIAELFGGKVKKRRPV